MANWHRLRKRVHLICTVLFVALPFLNVIRFDIPRQRFYFFGYDLWINEFAIIFFALMFLMFLVIAMSVFYGRVYCGYLCPQMIFSEASVSLESRLMRWAVKRGYPKAAGRAAFYGVVGAGSVFLAFVFMAYFVEPLDLLRSLASFDVSTAAGISGATVTALTFLDFTLLRQRFCTTACPYGYLQAFLGDGNTLLVHYRDESRDCIECKKCVRVCPMDIDIRKSPFQIECIHCAECIDACGEIMAKMRKPNLIHYAWGERGPLAAAHRQPWDARRIIVLGVLLCYAGGLFAALSTRKPVLAQVSADRAVMYRIAPDGRISNRFRYTLANRGKTATTVSLSAIDLPGAALSIREVPLQPGESVRGEFEILAPRASELVTHFTIVAGDETIPMTFLSPPEAP
jgi:cytochrome c oxidase accessory protein FixG